MEKRFVYFIFLLLSILSRVYADTLVNSQCPDGVLHDIEECDDGNTANTDSCLNTCVNARCGDGYKWTNKEECDDGNTINTDSCLNTCKKAICGDGYKWTNKEECDDGNSINTDSCTNDCKMPICGNGIKQTGEECDDGNTINTDSCLNTCKKAICGDGYKWTNKEECDDGNTINTDSCLNTCVNAKCGDGYKWTNKEECDDGNTVNTDACLNTCMNAICGDDFLWTDVEQCEDGNTLNNDCCSAQCRFEDLGEIICGIGECLNRTIACTEGIKNICTPNLPYAELCDEKDNDCDGETDDGVMVLSYFDGDGDGFGNEEIATMQCQIPKGYIEKGLDCDDKNSLVNPNLKEICGDDIDNNCNLQKEEYCKCLAGDKIDCSKRGGVCKGYEVTCGTSGVIPECEYHKIANYEEEEKSCDKLDNDCDGVVDEGCDDDKDGFIDITLKGNDCEDNNPNIKPGAEELCNGIDDDCNLVVDNINISPYCYELPYFNLPLTGVCKEMVAYCDSSRKIFVCNNMNYELLNEVSCDNLDNNCDGIVDENCPCEAGKERPCGEGTGECIKGMQKCIDERWGLCSAVQPSEELCDNKDNNCNGKIDENVTRECKLKDCLGLQGCLNGQWMTCLCADVFTADIKIDNNDIGMFVINADLGKEDVKNILSTIVEVNQSISSNYKNGKTEITTSFSSDKQLKDVDYALYIPKCLSQYLDNLDFEDKTYKIIQEDPLIAWHFAEVKDRIDLSYSINGKISEECLRQVKALPIAKIIGPRLEENQKFDLKKIILPIIVMIVIGIAAISFQNPKKHEEKKEENTEDLQNAVEKQRQSLLKQIKSMRFKSKEDAASYMRTIDMSEDTIQWILKKL